MNDHADRALQHFLLLSERERIEAIKRMADQGWPINSIARACRLADEQIRSIVGDQARTANAK